MTLTQLLPTASSLSGMSEDPTKELQLSVDTEGYKGDTNDFTRLHQFSRNVLTNAFTSNRYYIIKKEMINYFAM